MKRFVLVLFSLSLLLGSAIPQQVTALQSCNAMPFSENSEFILHGRPVLRVNAANAPQTVDVVIRDNYEYRNNGDRKFVDWVAYSLDGSTFGEAGNSQFAADPCLSPNRTLEATPNNQDDYRNAYEAYGFRPVHLVDPASLATAPSRSDLDLYSNIVPMHEALVDAWLEFEAVIRDYVVRENKPVYIIAGTTYIREMPSLPGADEEHIVPSGFWKFVYIEGVADYEQALIYRGIWLDQSGCVSNIPAEFDACWDENASWLDNDIRFVDIEGYTRLDFFTDLPNDEEYPMERRKIGHLIIEETD